MGYTTTFSGYLGFGRQLIVDEEKALETFVGQGRAFEGVSWLSYCQWELNENKDGLCWDGGEKFYYYVEWLEYLNKTLFIPWGVPLRGTIEYSGEEAGDSGIIVAKDGKITQITIREMAKKLGFEFDPYKLER